MGEASVSEMGKGNVRHGAGVGIVRTNPFTPQCGIHCRLAPGKLESLTLRLAGKRLAVALQTEREFDIAPAPRRAESVWTSVPWARRSVPRSVASSLRIFAAESLPNALARSSVSLVIAAACQGKAALLDAPHPLFVIRHRSGRCVPAATI
jgi:hypothetical protein